MRAKDIVKLFAVRNEHQIIYFSDKYKVVAIEPASKKDSTNRSQKQIKKLKEE